MASSPSLQSRWSGYASRASVERVEVAALLDLRAVAEGGLEEADVEADVVADEERVARPVDELRARLRRRGRLATSLSVMPWSCAPTIGVAGLTRVDQRSAILPPWTLTAPISTIAPSLTSRLVVSTSKTTNGLFAFDRVEELEHRLGAGLDDTGSALGLADLLAQLLLEVDDRRERAVAEHDRLGHDVLGQDLGAGLDHHDRVARAGDDQVELRLVQLAERSG